MSDPAFKAPRDIEHPTANLMFVSSALFDDESSRFEEPSPIFEDISGVNFVYIDLPRTREGRRGRPVCVTLYETVDDDGHRHSVPLTVEEGNNEPGTGNCDPNVQGSLSPQKVWLSVSASSSVVNALKVHVSLE